MSVEISFGTIFEQTFEGETDRYVITNIGEENWCAANPIQEVGGKLKISPMGGTTDLSDIHQVLDEKLTLGQIIEAMNNYWGDDGIPGEIVQILSERSKEKSRLLIQ
jgi:hypothetical protein